MWSLESIVDRLVAVYRVLEPHLVSTYVYHADATDPMADTPTVRLLHDLARIDQSHIAWGQAVLESLAADPGARHRAVEVQADVEERLVACGGVTGQGIESHWLAFASTGEAKTPERPKLGNATYRFKKRCAPVDHPVVEAPFWFSDTPDEHTSRYVDDASLDGFRSRFHQGGTRALPLGSWNWMAIELVNAHFRDVATIMRGMRAGMRLLTSGRLSLAGLVSHRFGLEEVGQAFATAVAKPEGFVKATVSMTREDG